VVALTLFAACSDDADDSAPATEAPVTTAAPETTMARRTMETSAEDRHDRECRHRSR
jgi:hypothetical protein